MMEQEELNAYILQQLELYAYMIEQLELNACILEQLKLNADLNILVAEMIMCTVSTKMF